MADILTVSRLERRFGGNRAVDGASFSVVEGSITGLIGPNGAGKTTAFNCISGFLRPNGGSIVFDGSEIAGMAPHRVFHRGLTRTFQIPQELGAMSVLENLMLVPARQLGERSWENWFRPGRVREQERHNQTRAQSMLEVVDLAALAYDPANSLSGGQRKLLELARALMGQPKLILLDEPSAGVNPTLAVRLAEHIELIRADMGVTFLLIGHDMGIIERLCDSVIVMTSGSVLTTGTPAEVLGDSRVQEAYLGSQYR